MILQKERVTESRWKVGEVGMTKQDILDYFSLIDFAYNESGRLESLSRMLDELLKEQEPVKPSWRKGKPSCGGCGLRIESRQKFCPWCGRKLKWE